MGRGRIFLDYKELIKEKRDADMNNENSIIQNLRDAGCDENTIRAFVEDLRNGRAAEGLKLLAAHRRSLLEDIHREQKQLDCLDYLVYTVQKQAKA